MILSWTRWGREAPGFVRALRRISGPVGLAASIIAFSILVFAAWHRGHAYSMIAGVVPWGDAHLFAGGAQRLLFFDHLDAYNSRRPFTAMFLALRLAVTGLDLRMAALLAAVVVGTAVFLAARAVARDLGPLPGLALFVGVYGFTRYFVPATVSETLGVIFAALAFATVWAALRNRSFLLAVGGVFLLGLALDVRAGVFLLPFLVAVLLARHLRTTGVINLKVLGASALAVVVAMSLNVGVVAGLGGDTGNVLGNGGMLIYGMARGHASWDPVDVSWFQVYIDHPEIMEMTDGERNRFVNALAREEVTANPGRFLRATVSSYGNYLGMAKRSILDPWSVSVHRPLMLLAAAAIATAIAVRARRGGRDRVRPWRWADLALFGGVVVAVPPLLNSLTPYLLPPDWLPTLVVATALFGVPGRGVPTASGRLSDLAVPRRHGGGGPQPAVHRHGFDPSPRRRHRGPEPAAGPGRRCADPLSATLGRRGPPSGFSGGGPPAVDGSAAAGRGGRTAGRPGGRYASRRGCR